MIALRCSNCGRSQQLDGAFTGCVCRCRFCAAIQTVPGEAPRSFARHFWGGRRGPTLLHCPDQRADHAPGSRDLTLVLAIALAALLAVSAAGGAIAWVSLAESRATTGPGAPQLSSEVAP